MNTLLWILQIVLAVLFAMSGLVKVTKPRDVLVERMPYVEDLGDAALRLVGSAELLAAIGLVLPAWTGILPILTPIAASGIALIMVLAMGLHSRRGEPEAIALNAALFVMAAVVAWGRFGPYSL